MSIGGERQDMDEVALGAAGSGRGVLEELVGADSGIGYCYRLLGRVVARWHLSDAILVVDDPMIGRQALRAGRVPVTGAWAQGLALFGEPGLYTRPELPAGSPGLRAAEHLCRVALRLEALDYRALHDPLTGLYNRRGFEEFLTRSVERARRYREGLAFVIADLDQFKQLNDRLGHLAGDAVLRSVGDQLRRLLRGADVAGRLGGDEFGLVLPDTDAVGAQALVERLRTRLREAAPHGPVGISAGIALCPSQAETTAALYQLADRRLYAAKEETRQAGGGAAAFERPRPRQERPHQERPHQERPRQPDAVGART